MAYTTPRTWVVNELLTAALLNEQVRDNESFLHTLATHLSALAVLGTNITTASTSFVDLTAAAVTLTLATASDVLLLFWGESRNSNTGTHLTFGWFEGATELSAVMSTIGTGAAYADPVAVCLPHLIKAVAAGAHTYKIQWKVSGGTGQITNGMVFAIALPNS